MALDQERRSAFASLAATTATAIPASRVAAARAASAVVACKHSRHLAGGRAVSAPAAASAAAAADVARATAAARFGELALDIEGQPTAAAATAAGVRHSRQAVSLVAVSQAVWQEPANGTRAASMTFNPNKCVCSACTLSSLVAATRSVARSTFHSLECRSRECQLGDVAFIFLRLYCVGG